MVPISVNKLALSKIKKYKFQSLKPLLFCLSNSFFSFFLMTVDLKGYFSHINPYIKNQPNSKYINMLIGCLKITASGFYHAGYAFIASKSTMTFS